MITSSQSFILSHKANDNFKQRYFFGWFGSCFVKNRIKCKALKGLLNFDVLYFFFYEFPIKYRCKSNHFGRREFPSAGKRFLNKSSNPILRTCLRRWMDSCKRNTFSKTFNKDVCQRRLSKTFVKDVCQRRLSKTFVKDVCQRRLSKTFVKDVCQRRLSKTFVKDVCQRRLSKTYLSFPVVNIKDLLFK